MPILNCSHASIIPGRRAIIRRALYALSPTFTAAVKRCGLGAVIAAAYQLTHDYDAAHRLGHEALRPHYSPATLIYLNDIRGHSAVLALFDEVIAAR
jgi:hypothetical protein